MLSSPSTPILLYQTYHSFSAKPIPIPFHATVGAAVGARGDVVGMEMSRLLEVRRAALVHSLAQRP